MLHRQSCLQASICTPDLLDTLGSELGCFIACPILEFLQASFRALQLLSYC